MSTVHPTDADSPGEPLRSIDELVETFRSAEKPTQAFLVGTEHEKFGFLRVPGAEAQPPLPYDGPRGIESILQAIVDDPAERAASDDAWVPALDRGRIIALFKGKESITLEPGGQFELSGAPFRTVHETSDEVVAHMRLLARICAPKGVGFIGMGFHPTATWDEMPMVPKARYEIMSRYMPRVGSRGLDMMKRTATVQANYDWEDEADLVAGYQMALGVAPLVAALFASAPFYEGKPSGAVSERQRVWTDTDPDRSGFPQAILDKDFSYERYVDWVLSVPMYFVRRDGLHHDVAGASFRTFMTDGLDVDGQRVKATMRDWNDHLTTIFPEVRMKRVLEVRSADCGPAERVSALPALYKGLLYDRRARSAALALMDSPSGAELTSLRADVAVVGFSATYRGRSVLSLSEGLLDIARAGLQRLHCLNARGEDEGIYLRPLEETVSSGKTWAEHLLDLYRGPWQGSLAPMWDAVEFWRE
jgi:glutamate--cysteine ligase